MNYKVDVVLHHPGMVIFGVCSILERTPSSRTQSYSGRNVSPDRARDLRREAVLQMTVLSSPDNQ